MPNPENLDPNPLNPRDPKGSSGSQLNPTRDHVQGEPEGTTPEANEHAPETPPSAPPRKPNPDYFDPTKP